MQIIDVKQESYFPLNFKIFGGLLIIGALISLGGVTTASLIRTITATALLVLGASMIFTRYGLKIDPKNKTYTVYTLLLGFKFGTAEPFNFIEKFYINQVTEQALATTRTGAKFDVKNKTFKAFIKLDNGEKIHLDTDKNEEKLKKRLEQYQKIASSVFNPSNS